MDFLHASEYITVFEVGLLILLNVVGSLFGRTKVVLLVNCMFSLYWCFFLNSDLVFDAFQNTEYSFIYFGFTLVILILTILGLTRED
jgi:hypothetical protein